MEMVVIVKDISDFCDGRSIGSDWIVRSSWDSKASSKREDLNYSWEA